ncbi:MAG: TIGR02996 domain-containing protein [Polyangiaceae bacterium]
MATTRSDLTGAELLARLLERWRETRSPALAEAIDALDEQLSEPLAPRLAVMVTPRVDTTLDKVRTVAELDDPRVSNWATRSLERMPFTTPGSEPLFQAWFDIVLARKDVRFVERAEVIRENLRTRMNRLAVRKALMGRATEIQARLEALTLVAPTDEELELAARIGRQRRVAVSEEQLLADVYARPDDDEPRLVYADWLLERQDPRGEFIMLQMKRRDSGLSPEETTRERELLKKHGKTWLGRLSPVLSFGKGYAKTTFERGFVSNADIILSVGKKLEPLWDNPEWATVERLEGSWQRELLSRAPLRALKALDRIHEDIIGELARANRTLPVTRIELHSPMSDWTAAKAVLPQLDHIVLWSVETPSVEGLRAIAGPGLRRLEIHRTWNAPRGASVDAEVADLVRELESCSLPIAELALEGSWGGDQSRPVPIELRKHDSGFALVSSPQKG